MAMALAQQDAGQRGRLGRLHGRPPPELVRRRFLEDWHVGEVEAEVQKALAGSSGPQVEELLQRGLWFDLGRQLLASKARSVIGRMQGLCRLVYTRSYVDGCKLQRWGYRLSGLCKFCGLPDTVHHRAWVCSHGDQIPRTKREEAFRREAQRAGEGHPLFSHLWEAKPALAKRPEEGALVGFVDAEGRASAPFLLGSVLGFLYGDGS